MKGYFSRIAKQSGLRFSGQQGLPSPFLEDEAAAGSAPLHLEERVMIAPHLSGEKTETPRPASHNAPAASDAPRKTAAVSEGGQKETASEKTRELVPDEVEEKPGAGFGFKDRSEKASPVRVEEVSIPVRTEDSIEAEKSSGEFSAIEKTDFTETGESREAFSQAGEQSENPAPKRPADLTNPERSDSSPGSTTGRETERKEYFVKTAEIIEKGETAEAAEVQKILFQEIQQWVADSPAALDITEPETDEKTAAVLTREVLRLQPPEVPQQALIPELITVREKSEPERAGRGEFAEQTFELSIGTISVVIEEPERPRQPEPPQAARQNTAGESKREFSRLSRHYL